MLMIKQERLHILVVQQSIYEKKMRGAAIEFLDSAMIMHVASGCIFTPVLNSLRIYLYIRSVGCCFSLTLL